MDGEEGCSSTQREQLSRNGRHGCGQCCVRERSNVLVDWRRCGGSSCGSILSQASNGCDPDTEEHGEKGNVAEPSHDLERSGDSAEEKGDDCGNADEAHGAERVIGEGVESLGHGHGGGTVGHCVEEPESETHGLATPGTEESV